MYQAQTTSHPLPGATLLSTMYQAQPTHPPCCRRTKSVSCLSQRVLVTERSEVALSEGVEERREKKSFVKPNYSSLSSSFAVMGFFRATKEGVLIPFSSCLGAPFVIIVMDATITGYLPGSCAQVPVQDRGGRLILCNRPGTQVGVAPPAGVGQGV